MNEAQRFAPTNEGNGTPEETRPDEAQPGETQPGETQPGETQPGETQPGETQPGETRPDGTAPGNNSEGTSEQRRGRPEQRRPEHHRNERYRNEYHRPEHHDGDYPEGDDGHGHRRRGRGRTRDRIISAALRLFTEYGYDKASLREIADAVGVTKAALYYHFRTKEDIAHAALQGYVDDLTAIVDRAETQPPGQQRNTALVDELLQLFATTGGAALRFGQANPTAMAQLHIGETHLAQLTRLVRVLAGNEASPEREMRAILAFGALVVGIVSGEFPLHGTAAERRAASHTVALELLAPLSPTTGMP